MFDSSRRVYARNDKGMSVGAPIWREKWREEEIVGETRASWVLKGGRKIPKRGGIGIAFSEEEIDRLEYINTHRYRIAAAVERCDDFEILSNVAELVGYKPPEVKP